MRVCLKLRDRLKGWGGFPLKAFEKGNSLHRKTHLLFLSRFVPLFVVVSLLCRKGLAGAPQPIDRSEAPGTLSPFLLGKFPTPNGVGQLVRPLGVIATPGKSTAQSPNQTEAFQ